MHHLHLYSLNNVHTHFPDSMVSGRWNIGFSNTKITLCLNIYFHDRNAQWWVVYWFLFSHANCWSYFSWIVKHTNDCFAVLFKKIDTPFCEHLIACKANRQRYFRYTWMHAGLGLVDAMWFKLIGSASCSSPQPPTCPLKTGQQQIGSQGLRVVKYPKMERWYRQTANYAVG